MYELSYGSNTRKSRLEYIKYLPAFIALFFLNNKIISYALWTISFIMAMYLHSKNEPKMETSKKIIPTYNLNRTQLLCMLRNIEKQKRI